MKKSAEFTVLFVCTGNIFRSMTAEYALRHSLGDDSGVFVHSAGLVDAPHEIVPFVREYLLEKGIDVSSHKPKKIDKQLLGSSDLTVAMDFDHRKQIENIYGIKLPLFSEAGFGTEASLLDVHEVVPDWLNNETAAQEYGWSVMDTIFDGVPGFIERLSSFIENGV